MLGGGGSEGKAPRRGDAEGGGGCGVRVVFEDRQCPPVSGALLRLCCQIKRGWSRATGGRNGSGRKRRRGWV